MYKILVILFLLSGAVSARSSNHHWLSVGMVGLKPSDPVRGYQVELKSRRFLRYFRTQVGLLTGEFDPAYVYGGVGIETQILGRLHFYPSFSPGIYFKGHGIDLGSPVEFRSCLDLFYQLNCKLCLGGQFFHLSNASIASHNPGVNGAVLYLAFGFL